MQTALNAPGDDVTIVWPDRLRRGIWPKPITFWLLVIYLAIIIIRPWEELFPELAAWRFERITLIVVGLVAILSGGLRGRLTRQAAALGLFMGAVWLSSRTAFRPDVAGPIVIELAGMVICYFFIVTFIRTPYQLFFFILCYVVIITLYLGKSEWEYFIHGAGRVSMGVRRLNGIDLSYGHPNQVAFTTLFTLPFWHFLVVFRKGLTQTWPARWQRAFAYFLVGHLLLSVSAILLTRSRAGAIGLVVFGILLAWRSSSISNRVRRFVLLALLLPVAFMVLPSDMRLRIQSSWDRRIDRENGMKGANTSADGRWYGFLAGIEMFRDRPLLGVGIGNFKDYRVAKCDGIYLSAHNLPGELLGELGICGGVTFLLVVLGIWLNWRAVARMARSSLAPDIRGLRLLMLACRDAILMMAYASVTQHTLQRYHWYMIAAFGVLAIKLATPAQYGVGSYFEESEVEGESLVLV